jgi:hypothetical protein
MLARDELRHKARQQATSIKRQVLDMSSLAVKTWDRAFLMHPRCMGRQRTCEAEMPDGTVVREFMRSKIVHTFKS